MTAETTLLVADDDRELLAVTSFALRHAGFGVVTAENGTVALDLLQRERFGLALLDINMPGADGFAVCEAIRHRSRIPVIVLSARDSEADIVRALETGADDYIKKPFSPRMLIARIQALLRRSATAEVKVVETDGARLDLESRSLDLDGRSIVLTPLEASILQLLLADAGRLVSVERLATAAWGRAGTEERHALKQCVYRLRFKLEDRTGNGNWLETVRNGGYRWVDQRGAAETSP